MDINDTTFVVTDTETTGTHRGARIIELAAVKWRDGCITDRFQQLINPGQSIPRRITQITGITTGMVFDQPDAEEVISEFLEFLGDEILVAHNMSFDLRMLNGELARMNRSELTNGTLCTLRLARRLLYELPSKGLTALLKHYDISMVDRHRALGDAEGAAEVLGRLISHFRFARGSSKVEELLEFQYLRYRKTRTVPSNVERIRRNVLADIPDAPGIYFLNDASNRPLYIGKAKQLKERVQTYFTGLGAHQERIKRLVEEVRDVSWRTTDTELDALLDESRLIKKHQPPYNRRGRRYRRRPFLRFEQEEGQLELSVTTRIRDDGAEYFGPVTPRREALQLVELLSHLFGLDSAALECEAVPVLGRTEDVPVIAAPTASSASRARHLRAFLRGEDRTIIDRMEGAMYEASEELAFERARWFRDQVERLDQLFGSLQWMGGAFQEYNAVLIHPIEEKPRTRLFFIRGGRLVNRCGLDRPMERSVLGQQIYRCFVAETDGRNRYPKEEVEEIRILLHWLRINGDRIRQVSWIDGEGTDGMLARIVQSSGEQRAA